MILSFIIMASWIDENNILVRIFSYMIMLRSDCTHLKILRAANANLILANPLLSPGCDML